MTKVKKSTKTAHVTSAKEEAVQTVTAPVVKSSPAKAAKPAKEKVQAAAPAPAPVQEEAGSLAKQRLTPKEVPSSFLKALQGSYTGDSGYTLKNANKGTNAPMRRLNFALFGTEIGRHLTERDACFAADLRDLFGANYFPRAGKVTLSNGEQRVFCFDTGNLRRLMEVGLLNVNPNELVDSDGEYCERTAAQAGVSATCTFYLTPRALRMGYGTAHAKGAWQEKKKEWDGKSAAFRAGDISEEREKRESM